MYSIQQNTPISQSRDGVTAPDFEITRIRMVEKELGNPCQDYPNNEFIKNLRLMSL